jgi:hypothetical protein
MSCRLDSGKELELSNDEQGKKEPSSPPVESLFRFRLPEVADKEVVAIRLEDGTIVFRSAEEVEEMEKEGKNEPETG